MTTPSDSENGQSAPDAVNLGKAEPPPSSDPAGEAPFDPYRFGKPDHPIPAEFAPPGYTGPIAPPPNPYAGGPHPGTAPPPGSTTSNPFGNPPGTPYAPGPQAPYPGAPPSPYGPPPGQPYGPQYGQQYGHQYGYGGQPPHYSQPTGNNGKAVAALVLGILSIVLCWLSVFDAVFVILALIFGLIALRETKDGRAHGRGLAIAGLACVVVGALLATIISIKVFHAIDRCGGFDQANQSSFNQCVRDNV